MSKETRLKRQAKNRAIYDDLDEIKNWLGRGGIKDLAKELGISPGYAYHIMAGRSRNIDFVNKARERAIANKTATLHGIKFLKDIK
jgi:hypothetical protein